MPSGNVRVKVREWETATAVRPRAFSAPFNPTSRNLQSRERGESGKKESRVTQNSGITTRARQRDGRRRVGLGFRPPEGKKRRIREARK